MNTPPALPRDPRWLQRARLAGVLLLLAASGCDDPYRLKASRPNVDATFELWAMTGSSVAYPPAILVPQASVVRLDAAGSFDLAFDIDGDGRLVVLPVSSVVSPVLGSRTIGLQRSRATFSAVAEAPRDGWVNDSALVVNPGQVFLAKVSTRFCQYDFRQEVYAKFYVDSVLPAERRIVLLARVNPNCGFRSLLSGIPEF